MSESVILIDCNDHQLSESLRAALEQSSGIRVVFPGDEEAVIARYACCWQPDPRLLDHSPELQLVQAASAGVDHLPESVFTSTVAISRVVNDNFRHGMFEYALWGVLWFQRYFDRALANQRQKIWKISPQREAADFRVGVMGLGEIGGYIAEKFSQMEYRVSGWSRTAKPLSGVDCYAGEAQFSDFLKTPDVLINLLPLTDKTRGILSSPLFRQLSAGCALINCGRGEHMVSEDVIQALDSGHLSGAVLDVFPVEPLEQQDPLWQHPNVVITPHMASSATVAVIARQFLDNIRRIETGLPVNYPVDKIRGY